MNVLQIIKKLKSYFGVKRNFELAQKLEISPNAISTWKKRNKINYELILSKSLSIDYNWLFNGQAKENDVYVSEDLTLTINTQEFIQKQNQGTKLPIVIIPEKAYAGYLAGFSDENPLELEIVSFKNYQNGNRYRCFEVSGDSMETSIKSGDYVLCERIEDKQSLKDGNMYVFCTYEGILCKRLEIKQEQLVLHSDNEKYSPKYIDKEQVSEFWKVIWIHRELK